MARLMTAADIAAAGGALAGQPTKTTAVLLSMNRRWSPLYIGPLFRALTAGGRQFDVYGLADARDIAVKVVGIYDQRTGLLISFATPLDFVETDPSVMAARAPTGVNGELPLPADTWAAFASSAGMAATYVAKLPVGGDAAARNLVMISNNNSATAARFILRSNISNAGIAIQGGGRKLNGDTARLNDMGKAFGSREILACNWDLTNSNFYGGRWGQIVMNDQAYFTDGATASGTPLSAKVYVPAGTDFVEAVVWSQTLSLDEFKGVLADQHRAYPTFYEASDAAWSWWTSPQAVSKDGVLAVGVAIANGSQALFKIDEASMRLLDVSMISTNAYPQDDHHAISIPYGLEGSGLTISTGHGVKSDYAGGGSDSTYTIRSFSHRARGVGEPSILAPESISKSNYIQTYVVNGTDVYGITNDDQDVSWVGFKIIAGGAAVQGRKFVTQAAAPGGGENQLYARSCRMTETGIRLAFMAHASNVGNAIRLGEIDMVSGAFTAGAASFGNIWGVYNDPVLTDITALPAIYTAPAGKGLRILDFKDGGQRILICEFDAPSGDNGQYYEMSLTPSADPFVAGNWTKRFIVASGVESQNLYYGGMCYDRKATGGEAIFVSREAGGTWFIDRMVSTNNGATWTTINLAQSTTSKLLRPISPWGDGEIDVIYQEAPYYSTFTAWTMKLVSLKVA